MKKQELKTALRCALSEVEHLREQLRALRMARELSDERARRAEAEMMDLHHRINIERVGF